MKTNDAQGLLGTLELGNESVNHLLNLHKLIHQYESFSALPYNHIVEDIKESVNIRVRLHNIDFN